MELLAKTISLTAWVLSVIRESLRISRRPTITVILNSVIARATRMLAFLLPLKVILLAGSEGIPRYFQYFISLDQKMIAILFLSAAAILAYAMTLFLEAHSRRLSEQGSATMLAASGTMAVVQNQHAEAQGLFSRFTSVAASLIFTIGGLLVLMLLDLLLAICLICIGLALYILTAYAVQNTPSHRSIFITEFISRRLRSFLGILSSFMFFLSFIIILYPFIFGENGNVIIAIVNVILVRQILSSLAEGINESIVLAGRRQLIDTLFFAERQFQQVEPETQRSLRDLFPRYDREALLRSELSLIIGFEPSLKVAWLDPPVGGPADFAVIVEADTSSALQFRMRVFPPRFMNMVHNERLLFSYIDRASVCAAPLVHAFNHASHECQIFEAGTGQSVNSADWFNLYPDILAQQWAVIPPPALVEIHSSSHSLLHERLTEEFMCRMTVAISCDDDQVAFDALLAELPFVRQRLTGLPLCLTNPEMNPTNTLLTSDGRYQVIGWGQWGLDVMGAAMHPRIRGQADEILQLICRNRSDIPKALTANDLHFAQDCAEIEGAIRRGKHKAALELVRNLISTQVVQE